MAAHHTDKRIAKLARRGLSVEQIARKIGRPKDLERVMGVLEREGLLVIQPTQGEPPICERSSRAHTQTHNGTVEDRLNGASTPRRC